MGSNESMDFPIIADRREGEERSLSPWVDFDANATYTPKPYDVPRPIINRHNKNRFGFSKDIGSLFEGGGESSVDKTDYVMGIVVGAMIIFLVAVVWSIAIVGLRISGPKRVGFLAGRFVRPCADLPGDDAEEDGVVGGGGFEVGMDSEKKFSEDRVLDEAVTVSGMDDAVVDPSADKRFETRVRAVRIMFVVSGIAVIVSGGIFYAKGIISFNGSLKNVRDGLDQVQALCRKGINLTESVFESQGEIEQPPGLETSNDRICTLNEEISVKIREVYKGLTYSVKELRAMLDGSLGNLNSDLNSLLIFTEDIDNSLEAANIFFAILIAISAILLALVISMIVGVFFAWKGLSNCFTKCMQYVLIWPLFILVLILSWIFAMLFLSASLAGSDFCINPDEHIESFLESHKEELFDSIMFGFVIYYVSGCTILPSGAEDFKKLAILMDNVLTYAHQLFTLLGDMAVDAIAQACGLSTADATALKNVAEFLHDATHFLNRLVVGLRELLRCETFNSIYITFVHQAFCVDGVSGLAYIFISSLIVAICSMVMIMLRAALYPIDEPTAFDSRGRKIIEVIKEEEQQNLPPDEAKVPALERLDSSLLRSEDGVQAVEDEGRNMPAEETAEETDVSEVKKNESPVSISVVEGQDMPMDINRTLPEVSKPDIS